MDLQSDGGNDAVSVNSTEASVLGVSERFLTRAQSKRLAQWKLSNRGGLLRAWKGACSPRHAIKLQCLDCCGEDHAAIIECGDRCCPLWKFRPFQNRKIEK